MNEVDKLIEELDPKLKVLAKKVREIVKKTLPKAKEVVKWGKPVYEIDGKKIAWLLFYSKHIDLGFFQGAKLKSPLLEGTGKGLRHIKIRSKKDIKEEEFKRLLKEATNFLNP